MSAVFLFWKELCHKSYGQRMDSFLEEIADRLMKLEEKEEISIETLKRDEQFLTLIYHAVRIAIGNHEQEKREALVNLVMNSASSHSPGKDLELTFLFNLDTMTSWHLRLLFFTHDSKTYCKENQISFRYEPNFDLESRALKEIFPQLPEAFGVQILTDLASRGLVRPNIVSWGPASQVNLSLIKTTTDLGDQFLSFISSPSAITNKKKDKE